MCAPCRFCNLDARLPSHAGTCTTGVAFEVNDKNASDPYTCLGSDAPGAGEPCTQQVDMQLDCDAMCVCAQYSTDGMAVTQSCSTTADPLGAAVTFCRCQACERIPPAEQEEGYQAIRDIALQAQASGSGSRRRLQTEKASLLSTRGLRQV